MSLLTLPGALLFRAENIIFKSEEENWGKMGVKCIKMSKNDIEVGVSFGTAVGIESSPGPFTSGPGMLVIDSNQLNSQCQMYEGKESNNILSTPNSLSGKLNRNKWKKANHIKPAAAGGGFTDFYILRLQMMIWLYYIFIETNCQLSLQ